MTSRRRTGAGSSGDQMVQAQRGRADVSRAASAVFWVSLAFGTLLRVVFVFSSGHHLDSDHGVVYLMARHVSEGDVPLFFWGQAYGGTLLSCTAGLAMLVFGRSVEVLLLVEIVWAAAAAMLLRTIVRRAFGGWAATVAASVWLFPGFAVLEMSVRDPGFYGPTIALALGVIALATAPLGRRGLLRWVAVGAVTGLALWTSPLGAALAAPALIALAVRDPRPLRWVVGAVAGLLAASPWILEALTNDRVMAPTGSGGYVVTGDSYVSLFAELLPAAFPGHEAAAVSTLYGVASIAALALLVVVGVAGRRAEPILLATGTLLLAVLLVLGADTTLRADSVRYTIFFVPAFGAAAGWLLSRLRLTAWIAVLLLPVLTATALYARTDRLDLDTSARWSADAAAVQALLDERGVHHAYGNYWLSYRLTAATDEDITVAALSGNRRYPPYEREAAAEGAPTILVDVAGANDTALTADLSLPASERVVVGAVAVYFFDQPFDVYAYPWDLV